MAFSAFPSLPGDTGGTLGRAGTAAVAGNTVVVKDLFETLQKFSKASKEFNGEMRKVAYTIARSIEAKVKIEAAVSTDQVERVIEAIEAGARTGKIGDGKVFVYDLEQVVRIRTGETGAEAL